MIIGSNSAAHAIDGIIDIFFKEIRHLSGHLIQ